MARQRGINTQLLMEFESVYGTAPGGNWNKVPFVPTFDVDSEQALIPDDVLGLGFDPQDPSQDVINVAGTITVPTDLRDLGWWLRALFGAPSTAGTDPYTHTWLSDVAAVPSFACEIGYLDIPTYLLFEGCKINTWRETFQRSGLVSSALDVIGQGRTRAGSTAGGTPTTQTLTRFNQFQGAIKREGSALGNVVSASLAYTHNLDAVEVIRSDGLIEGLDRSVGALTIDATVRFSDAVLLGDAEGNTPVEIILERVIDGDNFVRWTAHRVFLPKTKQAIDGPGGLQARYTMQAAYSPGDGQMLTVELKNDVASYA